MRGNHGRQSQHLTIVNSAYTQKCWLEQMEDIWLELVKNRPHPRAWQRQPQFRYSGKGSDGMPITFAP